MDNSIGIILCDDDKFILKLGYEKIQQQIIKNDLQAQVVCMSDDAYEIIKYLNNNKGSFLIFLDLDFGQDKLNGIDIAKSIKNIDKNTKIVFLTNHYDMAMDVLSSGVEPFGFIEKTTDIEKLSLSYLRYIKMAVNSIKIVKKDEELIELNTGIDEKAYIRKNEITFIESVKTISHGIAYHTINGSTITVRDSIENVERALGDSFIRVHRSVIANRDYIVGLRGSIIHLSNGEQIPCSVRRKREVKKWLKLL